MNLEIGSIAFEKFEILEFRGSGGNGTAYKARQIHLDKIVVLKVISVKGTHNRRIVRFHNEAKILSQLVHPNISQFLDFGISDDNNPYLAIEFVEGKTLREILDEVEYLDIEIALKIAAQLCGALDHAHKKGIVHRDIKPSNLVIQNIHTEPRVILLDFGIAKLLEPEDSDVQGLTPTGDLVGSPIYMSPEQTANKEITEATDQYSLGCVLFEMISGQPPYSEATSLETISKKCNEKAPRLGAVSKQEVPKKLEETIERTLSIEPTDRFKSISTLVKTIREIEEEEAASFESKLEVEEENEENQSNKNQGPLRIFIIGLSLISVPVLAAFVLFLFPPVKTKKDIKLTEKFESVFKDIDSNKKNQTLLSTFEKLDKNNEALSTKARTDIFKKTFLVPRSSGELDVFPNLQDMKLKVVSDLSEHSFEKVKNLKSLVAITILKNDFLIPSIKAFSSQSNSNLRVLHFNDTTINDEHLKELANIRSLRYLNIRNTHVTESGLRYLAKIPGLKRVELSTPLLSTDTIGILRTKMPACEFSDGPNTKVSLFEELKQKEISENISKLNSAEASARHYKRFWRNMHNLAVETQGENSYAATVALDQMIQYDIFFKNYEDVLKTVQQLKSLCKKNGDLNTLAKIVVNESDIRWILGEKKQSIDLAISTIPMYKRILLKTDFISSQVYNRPIDRLLDRKEYEKAAEFADEQYTFAIRWLPETDENIGVAALKALRVAQENKNKDSKYRDKTRVYADTCLKLWKDRRAMIKDVTEKDLESYIEALGYLSSVETDTKKREKQLLTANKLLLENPPIRDKVANCALGVFHRTAMLYEREGKNDKVINQYRLLIGTADRLRANHKHSTAPYIRLQKGMRTLFKEFLVRTGQKDEYPKVDKEITKLSELLKKHPQQ